MITEHFVNNPANLSYGRSMGAGFVQTCLGCVSEECQGEGYCFATYQETLPLQIFLSVSFVYIKPIVADWYLGALHKEKSPESAPAVHQVLL